jgi:glycosyltransferase involved in cell wall biosynthesis
MEFVLLIVFIVVWGIQLSYYLVVFSKLSFYKFPLVDQKVERAVSIIIAARNEEMQLKKLIPVLLNQQYTDFEIVVVDDRSDDHTYDYLFEMAKQTKRLKVVRVDTTPDKVSSKKYALTLGIKAASNAYLLLTDADSIPASPYWIKHMQEGFSTSDKEIVLGYSPYYREKGFLNLCIRFDTFFTAFQYLSFAMKKWTYMGVGRNLAYTKHLFMKYKGFHRHLTIISGDDDLFINQAATSHNVEIVIHPDSLVYSIPKQSWKEWWQQKKRHLSVGKYYKWTDQLLIILFTSSSLLFHVLFFILILSLDLGKWMVVAVSLYVIRMSIVTVFQYLASQKLKEKISPFLLPLLGFLHTWYYAGMGVIAAFSKKVKWK